MEEKLTITGPRSVGKTTISKKLSKSLNVPYFSEDYLMNKKLKEHERFDKVIKSNNLNLNFENILPIIKNILKKNHLFLILRKEVFLHQKLQN